MADYPQQLHSMDASPILFGNGRDNENDCSTHNHDPLYVPTGLTTHTDNFEGTNTVLIEEEEDAQEGPFLLPSSYTRANEDFSNINNHNNNHPHRHRSILHYCYSVSRLLIVDVLLELTSADNTSVLSKLLRLGMTVGSYFLLYTTATGHLMWGIAYLNDHGWYLLAASGSITLLLISTLVLTSYEWMWRWQERLCFPLVRRIFSCCVNNDQSILEYSAVGGRRRRMVVVHEDDDMEEDLSLRAWLHRFGKMAAACVVWLLYCLANIKIDFWITDQYILARPQYHRYELQLVNGFEAAPILVGAAVLLYWAYLPFYTWHGVAATASSDGVIAIAQVDPDEEDTIQAESSSTATTTTTTLQRLL
ncbi:hypothetical protein IV203_011477 [Nitzschia inconspicua]|uniref:Uncharacterized protein n=1 Tax=Nitzschia inconspicua TaxID=303405 RepID=A0A9K3PIW8_9STRA|nr:hypothetical protein IV203_011477 [Nitzschia inconspicua]